MVGTPSQSSVVADRNRTGGKAPNEALSASHAGNATVVSRTIDRAQVFSRTYGGRPADLRHLNSLLASSDIVFVATSATGHLITKEIVDSARDKRVNTKLTVVDLSNPRNVSPDVQEAHGVVLRTINDLRSILDESLVEHSEIVKQTEPLVRERVESILAIFGPPVISLLRAGAELAFVKFERAFLFSSTI